MSSIMDIIQGDPLTTSFRQGFYIRRIFDAGEDLFDAGSSIAVFDLASCSSSNVAVQLDMV